MFLLDTNVVSALRRPKLAPAALSQWAAKTPVTDLFLSAMTVYELELGIQRLNRKDSAQAVVLRSWMDRSVLGQFRDRILPIDGQVAARCAALQVPDLTPERDCFIGATAQVHRLVLVTRNVRDFQRLDLEIFNPWNIEDDS